jgi:hypothetical protein
MTADAVRQWVVVILGAAMVIYGMVDHEAELIMLGFTTLGCEPLFRAHPGKKKEEAT